eukprot:2546164-Ditylum_brightwellii.AAC.1
MVPGIFVQYAYYNIEEGDVPEEMEPFTSPCIKKCVFQGGGDQVEDHVLVLVNFIQHNNRNLPSQVQENTKSVMKVVILMMVSQWMLGKKCHCIKVRAKPLPACPLCLVVL